MTENIKHWKELTGDKLRTKLNPTMLEPDGFIKKCSIAIDRRNRQSVQGYVIFDKDYVLEVLKSQFIALDIDQDDAIDLIDKIYGDYSKEQYREYIELERD